MADVDAVAQDPAPLLSPRRTHVGHAWLSKEHYEAIERAAQARRIHNDRAIAIVLEKLIAHDCFEAVLDQ